MTDEHKQKLRLAHLGKKKPWAGKGTRSLEWRRKHSESMKGEKHWNWQGGKTGELFKARNDIRYKAWRKAVFERDNFTCQICGKNKCYVEADHIRPFAKFPDLRFEVSNGRTLCKPCHLKQPTHAGRLNRNNQYTKKHLLENKLITL